MPFGMVKLEWVGYPPVKKIVDMSIRFERDGRTDRQTPHDGKAALA